MHNNIMTAGLRDRPPMLATGRYAQWRSRFLRYIDTRTNDDALRKCILEGPYTPFTVIILAVPATDNSPAVPERTTIETILNMSPENNAHFELEKEIYKPTNNNLRTSSNTRNKNVNTTLRYKNDNQTRQFGNQRTMTIAGAKETVVETGDSNVIPDSLDMCDNDIQNDQNAVKCDDERVALANSIANLKLDVDENKKIQKQLKKVNTTLAQELTQFQSILAETSRTLGESNSIWDSCLVALQNKQAKFERYKTLNDYTVDYEKLEHKLNETLGLLAQKDIDIKECLKFKAYEISFVKENHDELVKQSLLTKSHYEGLVKEKTK
nr:hypothetical protein [Tanacetum cinerariifolium]